MSSSVPSYEEQHRGVAERYPPVRKLEEAAVRIGFPSTPLTDLYYNLLRGSWTKLIAMFTGFYLVLNLIFALLYLAGGDCIAGAEPGSFHDAFFFSVQSISTIGYGGMAPKTTYADLVVTAEAIVGILSVALATGLTFAKFARPRANLAFSRNLLISPYDGRRSLYFRVANIRGNDVVEASVRVAAAVDVKTAEGHTLRKLVDLELLRSRSPLFRLSWLVIHVIDEDSPLFGCELEQLYANRTMFVITLSGMDGTFAQAVHARHIYLPQDVVYDHHFDDIIRPVGDGQIEFDFNKFHGIHPLSDHQLAQGEREELEDEQQELLDADLAEATAASEAAEDGS